MAEKCDWLSVTRTISGAVLMLEPAGHADMCGAVLTEAVSPGSHAGVIFMHSLAMAPCAGHGIIAAATIALERGSLCRAGTALAHRLDTAAGTVHARATLATPAACRACRFSACPLSSCKVASSSPGPAACSAPTSRTAARSTRLSTAKRLACRSTRPTCRSCAGRAWRFARPGGRGARRASRGRRDWAGSPARSSPGRLVTSARGLRNVTVFADGRG